MFDNPLDLSYAMHEIHHLSYLQSHRSDYAYAIKMNPVCTYGIDDKPMVIGICFSCDDIDILPLHHLSHMPCHDHLASDMHCFGCCPSPYDVSNVVHEETHIVSSYMLGDLDSSYPCMIPILVCTICFPWINMLLMCHILAFSICIPIVSYITTILSWWWHVLIPCIKFLWAMLILC